MYLFAGPNGSGKSTMIAQFTTEHPEIFYICADEISRDPALLSIQDRAERNVTALHCAEAMVRALIQQGASFAYETVLSSQYKWPLLREAKACGYQLISVFVTTSDVSINIRRVSKRVAAGGHDVPVDKIKKRYQGSMNNLGTLLSLSDELVVYDNTVDSGLLNTAKIVLYHGPLRTVIDPSCQWLAVLRQQWVQSGLMPATRIRRKRTPSKDPST